MTNKHIEATLILILLVVVSVASVLLLTKDRTRNIPDGAFKVEGTVTRLSPNCEKTTYLQNDVVTMDEEPGFCDGGSFIAVDGTSLQYQTGLSPTGFWYELEDVEVGDTVTAIFAIDENGKKVINCEGCGIFK